MIMRPTHNENGILIAYPLNLKSKMKKKKSKPLKKLQKYINVIVASIRLQKLMRLAYLGRIKKVLQIKRTKDDYKRIAHYTFSLKNNKPLEKLSLSDDCVWNCILCNNEFTSSKKNVFSDGYGHNNCPARTSTLKKEKLSIEQIEARARECFSLEKNGGLTYDDIRGVNVQVKYWYKCNICNHFFDKCYNSMSNGGWCRYCSTTLCGDINCELCWDKSVASYLDEKKLLWNETNGKQAHEITRSSTVVSEFTCLVCGHDDIKLEPYRLDGGRGCYYCNHKKLCDNFFCEYCSSNSGLVYLERDDLEIISPDIAQLRELSRCCNKKNIVCQCTSNPEHEWEVSLANLSHGKSCPICHNKTQRVVHDALKNLYKGQVKNEKAFDWCEGQCKLKRFDVVLVSLKIILEIDGRQHNLPVALFNRDKTFEDIQESDRYKEECALKNGYHIIRLHQQQVWDNHTRGNRDWLDALLNAIKALEDIKEPTNLGYVY